MDIDTDAILDARAARLAVVPSRAVKQSTEPLVIVRADQTRYGIPARQVLSVLSVNDVAMLPGVSPAIAGLVNFRGTPVLAIHPTAVLAQSRRALTERTLAVVLGERQPELAILVDSTEPLIELNASELLAAPEHLPARARELISGVTGDGVVVFDVAAMFESERLHAKAFVRRRM